LHRRREHRVRADFDERVRAISKQRLDTLVKLDRAAQVLSPVARVHLRAIHDLAAHRRINRDTAGLGPHVGQLQGDPIEQRIHLRTVRGIVDLDPTAKRTSRLQHLQRLVDGGRLPRQKNGGGPIVGGDADAISVRSDRTFDLGWAHLDQRHGPLAAGGRDQLAAPADDRDGIVELQRAGDARRGHLPHAVADHGMRSDAPGLPLSG